MILVDEDEKLRVYIFQYGNVSLFIETLSLGGPTHFKIKLKKKKKIISDLSRTEI